MTTSYWCNECRLDFDGEYEPYTARDGTEYNRGRCSAGHRVVRYVTNRKNDPYYKESRKMQEEFYKYRVDFLQPGEPGFNTYYPHVFDKWYEEKEREEKALWESAGRDPMRFREAKKLAEEGVARRRKETFRDIAKSVI